MITRNLGTEYVKSALQMYSLANINELSISYGEHEGKWKMGILPADPQYTLSVHFATADTEEEIKQVHEEYTQAALDYYESVKDMGSVELDLEPFPHKQFGIILLKELLNNMPGDNTKALMAIMTLMGLIKQEVDGIQNSQETEHTSEQQTENSEEVSGEVHDDNA